MYNLTFQKGMENIMSWRREANCRDKDPSLFYPPPVGEASRQQEDLAKDICRVCNVQENCLEAALEKDEAGIWGGTTRKERTGKKDPWDSWAEESEHPPATKQADTPQEEVGQRNTVNDTLFSTEASIDTILGMVREGLSW